MFDMFDFEIKQSLNKICLKSKLVIFVSSTLN